jgi:hypothetical protein
LGHFRFWVPGSGCRVPNPQHAAGK